jgi:RND superfamily putative drug exporter
VGRRLRIAKWFMVLAWIIASLVANHWASKLGGVIETDVSKLLDSHAQSTQVLALQREAGLGRTVGAAVVYASSEPLTAEQRTAVQTARSQVAARAGAANAPSPVAFSADGEVAVFNVPLPVDGHVNTDVQQLRDNLGIPGLSLYVTGQAGNTADQNTAVGDIDSRLLLASLIVVVVLLLLTYRSPVLWVLPLVSVYVSLRLAQAAAYGLVSNGGTVTSLAQGILTVLIFGAGTDYALLLVARYREELHRYRDRHDAMAVAWRRTVGALTASAGTVVVSMLCLLSASFGQTRYLGPVLALGIVCALAVSLTLLPALLLITGRWVFWPRQARYGDPENQRSVWHRIADRGARTNPRPRWILITIILLALGAGLAATTYDLTDSNGFRTTPNSVAGQTVLGEHFPAGASSPVQIVAPADQVTAAMAAAKSVPGVQQVSAPAPLLDRQTFNAILSVDPGSAQAQDTVRAIRKAVGPQVLVGGRTAVQTDIRDAANHDNKVAVPLILGAILVVLILLLRAVVAPLVLIASVALSFAAAYGLSMLIFRFVLHFPGTAPYLPLYSFLFLVALGVDYTIFLMHRAREETTRLGTGPGVWRATAATGGVITSAGLVLAGTFAVLATLPLVEFVEVGLSVALGVLLDTFVVRTLLVPSAVADLGDHAWWPAKRPQHRGQAG